MMKDFCSESYEVGPNTLKAMTRYSVGMSNHVRLDIRRFGSGIRIHPNVRIVCMNQFLHGIYQTIL